MFSLCKDRKRDRYLTDKNILIANHKISILNRYFRRLISDENRSDSGRYIGVGSRMTQFLFYFFMFKLAEGKYVD